MTGARITAVPDRRSRWTDELTAKAQRMWSEGLSAREIAAALGHGFTRNSVIGMAHRHKWIGGSKNHATPEVEIRRRSDRVKRIAEYRHNLDQAKAAAKTKPVLPPAPMAIRPGPPVKRRPDGTIGVLELTPESCRWPTGDPRMPGFTFCGEDKGGETGPYCTFHARLAYGRSAVVNLIDKVSAGRGR